MNFVFVSKIFAGLFAGACLLIAPVPVYCFFYYLYVLFRPFLASLSLKFQFLLSTKVFIVFSGFENRFSSCCAFSKLYACIFNFNNDFFALQSLSYQIALSCLGFDISLNLGFILGF